MNGLLRVCKCIYSETDAATSCMFWKLKPKCKATLMWNEENENGLWYLFLANLNGVFELLWFSGDSDRNTEKETCIACQSLLNSSVACAMDCISTW